MWACVSHVFVADLGWILYTQRDFAGLGLLVWLGIMMVLTVKSTQLRITWEESFNAGWPMGTCVIRACCWTV